MAEIPYKNGTANKMNYPNLKYNFLSGPIPQPELSTPQSQGNCRLAIQLYFHQIHNQQFAPEEILCPQSYHTTGTILPLDLTKTRPGDVIFAERIKTPAPKLGPEEYIVALHTAIILSTSPIEIWHATIIAGGTCFWSLAEFEKHYKIVRLKRFLRS